LSYKYAYLHFVIKEWGKQLKIFCMLYRKLSTRFCVRPRRFINAENNSLYALDWNKLRNFHFRALDPDNQGTIDTTLFMQAMTSRGEMKLSREVLLDTIQDPQYIKQGQFDYVKFVDKVFETSSALIKAATEVTADKEGQFSLNSKTYRVRVAIDTQVCTVFCTFPTFRSRRARRSDN
jgi:hypothetical protein